MIQKIEKQIKQKVWVFEMVNKLDWQGKEIQDSDYENDGVDMDNEDDRGNGKFLVGDKLPNLTKKYELIQQIRKNDLIIKNFLKIIII